MVKPSMYWEKKSERLNFVVRTRNDLFKTHFLPLNIHFCRNYFSNHIKNGKLKMLERSLSISGNLIILKYIL